MSDCNDPVPAISLELIEKRTGIADVDLLVTVARVLADEAPVRMAEIEQGLAEQDAKQVSIAAHTLKGACRAMAMTEVAESAERVETAGRNGELDEAAQQLPRLRQDVDAMLTAIQRFVAEHG
jgi:HPt (histidine-containing phosphotransfer) domain-containing protein